MEDTNIREYYLYTNTQDIECYTPSYEVASMRCARPDVIACVDSFGDTITTIELL